MGIKRLFAPAKAVFILPLLIAPVLASAQRGEIEVTLFGHPCRMSGPYSEETLKTIHSISPERIPPAFSLKQLQATLGHLEEIRKGDVPAAFENYLEKNKKRLEALADFYAGIDAAKKANALKELFDRLVKHTPTSALGELRPVGEKLAMDWSNMSVQDQLLDIYQHWIEPDPEAKFHRATKALKIRYTCNFKETD